MNKSGCRGRVLFEMMQYIIGNHKRKKKRRRKKMAQGVGIANNREKHVKDAPSNFKSQVWASDFSAAGDKYRFVNFTYIVKY